MNGGKSEASLGELLGTLATETGVLVRKEVQLASTEMTLKAKAFARSAGSLALGGALAFAGILAALAALILALAAWLALWGSALLVGVVLLGGGYAFAKKGLDSIRKIEPIPEQTIETLRDDVTWAKEQVR